MSARRWGLRAIVLGLAATAVASGALSAQGSAGESGIGFGIDTRLAFLISDPGGHPDRPLIGVNGRLRVIDARTGPGVTMTGGFTIGFSEFFAEVQSESFRYAGGLEVPFSLGQPRAGGRSVTLVPLVEVGHLESNGGDERSGLFGRLAIGLRIPVGEGPLYLGFEPLGLTLLPTPLKSQEGDSRLAFEMGLIRVGWDF